MQAKLSMTPEIVVCIASVIGFSSISPITLVSKTPVHQGTQAYATYLKKGMWLSSLLNHGSHILGLQKRLAAHLPCIVEPPKQTLLVAAHISGTKRCELFMRKEN